MGLKSQLEKMGHIVVAQAADADQAEAFFREKQPDLVLTDIRLNSSDGLALAQRLLKIRPCPILVVSAYGDKELIGRATSVGVFGYLIKPVSDEALAAQIEVAVARCREHSVLVAEKQALTQSLEHRKLIDRAKGILMQRANLTEAEAHKRLQQESQKRRISAGTGQEDHRIGRDPRRRRSLAPTASAVASAIHPRRHQEAKRRGFRH